MNIGIEDWDEWDTIFMEQAINVTDQISSTCKNPTSSSSNFSPPRELSTSQNNPNSTTHPLPLVPTKPCDSSTATSPQPQETEVDILKRELRRISTERAHLENENAELKRRRRSANDKKQDLTTSVPPLFPLHHAPMEDVCLLQDRLQSSQFQNASTSMIQDGPEYALEAKDNRRSSSVRESSRRSSSIVKNIFEGLEHANSDQKLSGSSGLNGKNVQVDGTSVTTDLRRRILIDSALTTSNECSTQKLILPETTARPKYSKAVGVQTDSDDGCSYLTEKNGSDCDHDLLSKFSTIWGLSGSRRAGKGLVSRLFPTCAADFYALFRFLGRNMPSTLESLTGFCFQSMALHDKLQNVQSVEAAKVAHLYFVLTKINNEMLQLDSLIDVLIDLCSLNNVIVVHRSLRIMHVVLQYVLGLDARSGRRDNVTVEGTYLKNNILGTYSQQKVHTGVQFVERRNETSVLGNDPSDVKSFDLSLLLDGEHERPTNQAFVSALDLLSLFEKIHRIVVGSKEECIQVEAISVMNLIIMRSNPCLEREKYGSGQLFESLSTLLQKDVSLQVRKQAVHLLFLLLNCPKILVLLCSRYKEDAGSIAAADCTKDALTSRVVSTIFGGLAECVKCRGHHTQELNLRRFSVKVLAFVASSGKSGFEVLLNPKIWKGCNLLELIMQALASEMEADPANSMESSEACKERISLVREILILLNRLASNPAYSSVVLQVLTSNRDTLSMTIDVANRMSRKGNNSWKSDGTRKRKAEDEVEDLARVFRTRVFAYLGYALT